MKRNCGKKRVFQTFFFPKEEKKNETPRAVLKYRKNNKRKETKISLLSLSLSLLLLEESKELLISLLLLVFDFTTIQTTIDTDDAQEERETTGITRQKERAD